MSFALHFIALALCAVPALLVFRYGVVRRKQSNFFCFGMNPVILPVLHPLLVVAVSKVFLWIAFTSVVDMNGKKPEDLQRKIESLDAPTGTVWTRVPLPDGFVYKGKISWKDGGVDVKGDGPELVIPPEHVARVKMKGGFSFLYYVFRLLFSLVIPASVLVLLRDLYNPRSVLTAFACAAASFALWSFTIQL